MVPGIHIDYVPVAAGGAPKVVGAQVHDRRVKLRGIRCFDVLDSMRIEDME